MYLFDLSHIPKYQDIEELIKVFLPPEEYRLILPGAEGEQAASHEMDNAEDPVIPIDLGAADPGDKNAVKRIVYRELSRLTGQSPEWGIMTGVRPVKLVGQLVRKQGIGDSADSRRAVYDRVADELAETYLLTDQKIQELLAIYDYQQETVGTAPANTVGLYLGIPFCPTRCLYCSFSGVQAPAEDIAAYLEALHREVIYTGDLLHRMGVTCESVYFGGGTPTTLTGSQLDELLALLTAHMPLTGCREFTLEAGRPDTITAEKLAVAKAHGVSRISINPQTMKQATLDLIGRRHDVEDIYRAFEQAHQVGMTDINCDLIAGLPLETAKDFEHSLSEVLSLHPSNITVHTLAVKRGSRLKDADEHYHYKYGAIVQDMLAHSRKELDGAGFKPYYLYRQKHMAGAGENTGYCLPGTEGVYNIRIMEEDQAIVALGAGGISKSHDPATGHVARAANVSDYHHYIRRIDEMCRRKEDLYHPFIKED